MIPPLLLTTLHRGGIIVACDSGGLLMRCLSDSVSLGLLEQARSDAPSLRAWFAAMAACLGADRLVTAPLSSEQLRLWFLGEAGSGEGAQLIELSLRFRPGKAMPPPQSALPMLASRHEMLSALILEGSDGPLQCFPTPPCPPHLYCLDLRHLDSSSAARATAAALRSHAARALHMDREPGLRCLHILEPDGAVVVQLVRHHLVSDGWSLGLLLESLKEVVEGLRAGCPLPAPSRQSLYAEHACRQRLELADGAANATAERLRGKRLQMLPASSQQGRGAVLRRTYDRGAVQRRARAIRQTEFSVAAGLFALALGSLLGQPEVAIIVDVSTRQSTAVERCIGTFVNRAALLIELPTEGPMQPFLAEVASLIRAASDQGGVPYDRLVKLLTQARGSGHGPMFDVLFGMHAEPRHAPYRQLGDVELLALDDISIHLPVSFYLTVEGAQLHLELLYDDTCLGRSAAQSLSDMFDGAIAALDSDDVATVRRSFRKAEPQGGRFRDFAGRGVVQPAADPVGKGS